MLLPLMQMNSVLLYYWVWQAFEFALMLSFCWSLCHANFIVLVLGQTVMCSFVHIALCVVCLVDLLNLCFNE